MHAPITISSEAGAVGEAGEVEKDSRHDEDVTASGGIFFPLVVESLGLWTPTSLQVLRAIASKAILNGIPHGLAVRNLLLQLSTCLWTFNASMLHTRLAAEGLDVEEWDIPTSIS